MRMWFHLNEKDILLLAVYVSQLVREGVVFSIRRDEISVEVTLEGGF